MVACETAAETRVRVSATRAHIPGHVYLSSSRPLLAFTDHAHILAITLFARSSGHRSCLERGPSSTAR